jgi:hypothetical protein
MVDGLALIRGELLASFQHVKITGNFDFYNYTLFLWYLYFVTCFSGHKIWFLLSL